MKEQVLIVMDAEHPSETAFVFGLNFARRMNAGLLILAVVDLPHIDSYWLRIEWDFQAEMEDLARKTLEPYLERARAAGVEAERIIGRGKASDQIAHISHERGRCVLAVVGLPEASLKKKPLDRVTRQLMEAVTTYLSCPLVTVSGRGDLFPFTA